MLVSIAKKFARAQVPAEIASALALGRMTASLEVNGRVRGIVAGSVLRRLVGKTLALEFGTEFLEATAPFQYALQTKAGTDALGQAIRYLTDKNEDLVLLAIDGIGAFDHVKRAESSSARRSCMP